MIAAIMMAPLRLGPFVRKGASCMACSWYRRPKTADGPPPARGDCTHRPIELREAGVRYAHDVIRTATPGDIPVIGQLIRELAQYERLSHEVLLDERELHRHLFGGRPYAEVLLAEDDRRVVGFALFFHNFSTFLGKPGIYLEDLYVQAEHRARGYGKELLAEVARIAVERGCGRLEWSVLDWNEPSIGFYRSLGARAMDDWTVYRLDGRALSELAANARQGAPFQ